MRLIEHRFLVAFLVSFILHGAVLSGSMLYANQNPLGETSDEIYVMSDVVEGLAETPLERKERQISQKTKRYVSQVTLILLEGDVFKKVNTGTQKVANADDLAVNVTLPLPDDLVSYAGNNKVGVVVNGVLEDKRPTFTTIDGVPCIKFTGTHFSPYTIYVDTENVVRGVYDETPKTGDGVSPKWFLSAGMMSLSCVLFLWKDKKKPVKKAAAATRR